MRRGKKRKVLLNVNNLAHAVHFQSYKIFIFVIQSQRSGNCTWLTMRFQFWRSIGVRIIARVPNNVFCCLSPFTVGAGIAWSVYRLPYALGIRTVMFDSWQRQKNYLYCEEFRPALEPIQLLFNFLFHGSLAPTGPTAPHY